MNWKNSICIRVNNFTKLVNFQISQKKRKKVEIIKAWVLHGKVNFSLPLTVFVKHCSGYKGLMNYWVTF